MNRRCCRAPAGSHRPSRPASPPLPSPSPSLLPPLPLPLPPSSPPPSPLLPSPLPSPPPTSSPHPSPSPQVCVLLFPADGKPIITAAPLCLWDRTLWAHGAPCPLIQGGATPVSTGQKTGAGAQHLLPGGRLSGQGTGHPARAPTSPETLAGAPVPRLSVVIIAALAPWGGVARWACEGGRVSIIHADGPV